MSIYLGHSECMLITISQMRKLSLDQLSKLYLGFKPNSDFKASHLFTTHSIHSVPNPHHYLSLKLKSWSLIFQKSAI